MNLNIIYYSAVIFALLVVTINGNADLHRVFGGSVAKDEQFPYVVLHMYKFYMLTSICSGSLITPKWVLLAAHCVKKDTNPRHHIVVAGRNDYFDYSNRRVLFNFMIPFSDSSFNLQERQASKVFAHPSYSGPMHQNDVALIQTRTPFDLSNKVALIPLSREPMGKIRSCSLAGFGRIERDKEYYALHYLENMEAKPYELCEVKRAKDGICLTESSRGVCMGDSGGPLVCDGFQRGVASHIRTRSSRCGVGVYGQYYTDTYLNLDWIEKILNDQGDTLP